MSGQNKIIPVILSGGVGSRLWPLSREAHPKPFIKLPDGESLIQKTYKRASKLKNVSEIVSVTSRELLFYMKDEYSSKETHHIHDTYILEPCGRDTAAAIATACHQIYEKHGDAIVLILPADHHIANFDKFQSSVDQAALIARSGNLITFGIMPTRGETAFGYIHHINGNVAGFREKPDAVTAEQYFSSGNYLWNSGMFCFSALSFLNELKLHAPGIFNATERALMGAERSSSKNMTQIELSLSEFQKIEKISIDYAVFEKSKNLSVVPCDFDWSDVGSWNEFGEILDQNGTNTKTGNVMIRDSENCVISAGSRLVVTMGMSDTIIADTSDALLVASREYAQDVKQVVKSLRNDDRQEVIDFPQVFRPWGNYTVLLEQHGFKIKRIEVKPKGKLSLQSHKYRSEHWVVVSGTAFVTIDESHIELNENESTYIPLGAKHRLENKQIEPLVIVEVQCGTYLGEDDIQRFDDVYGRRT